MPSIPNAHLPHTILVGTVKGLVSNPLFIHLHEHICFPKQFILLPYMFIWNIHNSIILLVSFCNLLLFKNITMFLKSMLKYENLVHSFNKLYSILLYEQNHFFCLLFFLLTDTKIVINCTAMEVLTRIPSPHTCTQVLLRCLLRRGMAGWYTRGMFNFILYWQISL